MGKLCHCTEHWQCPGGFCDRGAWSTATNDGKCGVKQQNDIGAYCEDNQWCAYPGSCYYAGKFVHSTCASSRNWPHGHACDVDAQCGPDPNLKCTYWNDVLGGKVGYYCGY